MTTGTAGSASSGIAVSLATIAPGGISGAPLTAKHRAVSIVGQGEEIFFLFESRPASINETRVSKLDSQTTSPRSSSANVIQLLKSAVATGEISESEAEQIFIELSELTGARYQLPETRREIMASLGFPEGTVMLATNWFEMAAVHLETSLSTSALTSRFILHALGVKSVVADSSAGAVVDPEAAKAIAEIKAAATAPVTVPAIVEPAVSEKVEPAVSEKVEPAVSESVEPQVNATVAPAIFPSSTAIEESLEAKTKSEASAEARDAVRETSLRSNPVVIEADRNPLALEAAPESGNFVPKPALK